MSRITLVPDPTWKGKTPAPLMVRADAMRKLAKAGLPVKDIAVHFKVPYSLAYKAVQPPRLASDSPRSTGRKPLTSERLRALSTARLKDIAYAKSHIKTSGKPFPNPAYNEKHVLLATEELDRRDPKWQDEDIQKASTR